MKFEEILPALRAGKKVRRMAWAEGEFFCPAKKLFLENNSYHVSLDPDDVLAGDWLIIKDKVRYYPALVRHDGYQDANMLFLTVKLFKNFDQAKELLEAEGLEIIRLVTNIPQLIEEYEE